MTIIENPASFGKIVGQETRKEDLMKIRMRNTIQFDEQLEVIDQLYDVEVHEKGDYSHSFSI